MGRRILQAPPRDWLMDWARAGKTQAEARVEWGRLTRQEISQPQMSAWFRRYGIMVKQSKPNPRAIPSPGRPWLIDHLDLKIAEMGLAAGGVSDTVIFRWLREEGLVHKAHCGRRSEDRVKAITRERLLALVDKPAYLAAAELHLSVRTVRRLMENADIEYHPSRRKSSRLKDRWAKGEDWAMHDCPDCPRLAECHGLERQGLALKCYDDAYKSEFIGSYDEMEVAV
jgi:hypothetical protein